MKEIPQSRLGSQTFYFGNLVPLIVTYPLFLRPKTVCWTDVADAETLLGQEISQRKGKPIQSLLFNNRLYSN